MEYTEYNFKGKVNSDEFVKHLPLADEIRKFYPDTKLKVEETIISYSQKGRKKPLIEMTIKIYSEKREHQEDVKNKLEKILGQELTEKKI
jgi:hypothetical protein